MAKKIFRIDLLGSVAHNEETLKIFEGIKGWGKWSEFVRSAIVEYARNKGCPIVMESVIHQPVFLDKEQWEDFRSRVEKSKLVDYEYYLAFFWLWSQDEFKYISQSNLLRMIITS